MQRPKSPEAPKDNKTQDDTNSLVGLEEKKPKHAIETHQSQQSQADLKESKIQSIPVKVDQPKYHPTFLAEIQKFNPSKLKHVMVQSANVYWHSFVAIVSGSAQARKKTRSSAPTVITFDKKTDYWHIEPKSKLSSSWQTDLKSIKKKEATVKSYPLISATIVFELQEELLLYNRFLIEKNTALTTDKKESDSDVKREEDSEEDDELYLGDDNLEEEPPKRHVLFMTLPDDDPFIANCNKTMLNFLREAAFRSERVRQIEDSRMKIEIAEQQIEEATKQMDDKKQQTPEAKKLIEEAKVQIETERKKMEYAKNQIEETKATKISKPSKLSFGAKQRMFICNSVLHQSILKYFIPDTNKQLDEKQIHRMYESGLKELNAEQNQKVLQTLADNKKFILKVVLAWPLEQQLSGLQQISSENTPLGLIFRTAASPKLREKKDRVFLELKSKHNLRYLQELADNKEGIFKIILSWPREKQIGGLKQILDGNTPLGIIFKSPRSDKQAEKTNFHKLAEEKLKELDVGLGLIISMNADRM